MICGFFVFARCSAHSKQLVKKRQIIIYHRKCISQDAVIIVLSINILIYIVLIHFLRSVSLALEALIQTSVD